MMSCPTNELGTCTLCSPAARVGPMLGVGERHRRPVSAPRKRMSDNSGRVFGLLVAYVVPGFVGLTGLIPLFPSVGSWLHPVPQGDLGFGPPVYALLGATAVGLIVSCFRWLLLDQLHHWTSLRRPVFDDSRLQENLEGFDYLVQNHYRYYEFTGNTLLAGLFAYLTHRGMATNAMLGGPTDLAMTTVALALFWGGRDALRKYYRRTAALAGATAEEGGCPMFNGNHHSHEGGAAPEKRPTPNKSEKPDSAVKPVSKDEPMKDAKPAKK